MSFVEWKPEYELGNRSIDRQHRALAALLNEWHDAVLQGATPARVEAVSAAFTRYTESHFRNEELMLDEAGYPALDAHRREHAAFLRQLGSRGAEPFELLRWARIWFLEHIITTDRAYMPFVGEHHSAAVIGAEELISQR